MKDKIIVVTGGSGYIGTDVVLNLIKKGYRVINIDKKIPSYKTKNSIFIKHNLLKPLKKNKDLNQVAVCIHLAAEVGGVDFANKHPAMIMNNNSQIDLNVIDFCVRFSIKKIIYISSSLVYEKCKKFPLAENETNNLPPPSLSYGFAKLMGEKLCIYCSKEYGIEYSICRVFNAYGINQLLQNDPNSHVIPDLIKKVKSGQYPIELFGSKDIKRNFTHVKDISAGIIAVMENTRSRNEIFNIADSKEYSLYEILSILWKIETKKRILKIKTVPSFKLDVKRNLPDVKKSKELLNWQAEIDMKDGLCEIMKN